MMSASMFLTVELWTEKEWVETRSEEVGLLLAKGILINGVGVRGKVSLLVCSTHANVLNETLGRNHSLLETHT